MKIYLKIVLGDWRSASRDKRELHVAEELGYQIVVIASTKNGKKVYDEIVNGYHVIRIPTRKYGEGKIRKYLGYCSGIITYIMQVKKIDACMISGHNYDALLIGYLSQKGKKRKAKLIYDSHEFELYQKQRAKIIFSLVKCIEGFLVKRTDINMMVTDSIADEIQQIYSLKERPLVVRNVPQKSEIHQEIVSKNRKEFVDNLHISENGFIVMYHGGVAQGRGIEECIYAVSKLEDTGIVIMGYALDEQYKEYLVKFAEKNNVLDRVYFKNAVEFGELYGYIAAADVGVVLIQNTCRSFFYSLPNKLFESIQAITPVIGSDFPEIGGIISKYKIGIKIDPNDKDALVEAIRIMKDDREVYQKYKENEKTAREELCWEKESKKLENAIRRLE